MIFTDPLFGRLWVHVNPLVGKVGPGISDGDASSLSLASLASSLPNSLYISFLFCNQPPLLPSPLPNPLFFIHVLALDFSTPTQRVQSGSTAIVLSFPTGMISITSILRTDVYP